MAIRIVKNGHTKQVFEWFGECWNCGCQMVADEWDAKWPPCPPSPIGSTTANDPEYDPKRFACVDCESCGKRVLLTKRIAQ